MKSIGFAGIIILILSFIVGCLADYGIVRKQTPADNKMTFAELIENFENYHVYYGKPGGIIPRNILFDPKNDDIRFVGDGWYKIADQKVLSEKINEIHAWFTNREVMIVEGPDRQFFGYMYCTWDAQAPTGNLKDNRIAKQKQPNGNWLITGQTTTYGFTTTRAINHLD